MKGLALAAFARIVVDPASVLNSRAAHDTLHRLARHVRAARRSPGPRVRRG